ncbi:putative thiol methyltransferase 2 [Triticum urartu]|uniref:Putative thiol methyltransferase 2 n=1 Tax=Triticum urartu TaxID=4572 RepID=M7ZWW3_TRIUA|nr:putative thiol methyltransferase 2 [Triticum urartu]
MGYDVVALASPERFVVGLEISNIAAEKAKQWSSSLPNADWFSFLIADFFKWRPSEPFDLIFDYTLILEDCGGIAVLLSRIMSRQSSSHSYQNVLEPLGFKAVWMEDNELAIKPRKGFEKLGRWKRCGRRQSSFSSCALPERCMRDVPFTASVRDEIGRVKFPCALNEHRMAIAGVVSGGPTCPWQRLIGTG